MGTKTENFVPIIVISQAALERKLKMKREVKVIPLDKKAIYNIICANCGTEFEAYGNKDRKFCSHNCYIASRFGKEVENEARG